MRNVNIHIVRDDREKNGWPPSYFGPGFELWQERLATADYTIDGMEKLVAIERKSGWAELYYDFTGSRKATFCHFLERLKDIPVHLIIVEDDIASIRKVRINNSYIPTGFATNAILDLMLQYGFQVLPVGKSRTKSAPVVRELFRKIVAYHKIGQLFGENR